MKIRNADGVEVTVRWQRREGVWHAIIADERRTACGDAAWFAFSQTFDAPPSNVEVCPLCKLVIVNIQPKE